MNFRMNEQALTEVVGFVLILGVIAAAFSLYLTYAVPAQGRENEIQHMNEVKDEFTQYKFTLDALWSNNQLGNSITSTFSLGTGGSFTQGGNRIMPILNPIASSATFTINHRNETLTVSSRSLITDTVNFTYSSTAVPGSLVLYDPPGKLLVNISNAGNLQTGYGIRVNGTGWYASVNKTPRYEFYLYPSSVTYAPDGKITNITFSEGYKYNRTDITVSVFKDGKPTIENLIVYSNIAALSSGQNYTVNLMDDTYGIRSFVSYPTQVIFTKPGTSNDLIATGIAVYDYTEQESSHAVSLGAIEYASNNYYWIQQRYFYQMGGVFLEQDDGASYKLAPAVTMTYNNVTGIMRVKINEIVFDPSNSGIIGGTSPVQVRTRLSNMTALPYAPITANTKSVTISVASSDPFVPPLWYEVFDETANKTGGVPRTFYQLALTPTTGSIIINGPDYTGSTYDILLEAERINFYVKFHGLGGILE
ncbi:hypothetical protein [Methanoregula sp.]|uniref:hypothetical protein n=1 Tax=Methanoregula sp. TaxID=2052170 RepID=UPI000CA8D4E6|nr:hypothetical protein [Methanoregula sp.]PKG31753.1 MAG: hypothetical protein CW742_11735 [Methanoregula sp.]